MAAIAAFVSAFGATAAYLNTADRLRATVDESLIGQAREFSAFGADLDHDHRGPVQSGPRCPLPGAANVAQTVAADGTVTPCFESGIRLPAGGAVAAVKANGRARLSTVTIRGTKYRVVTAAQPGDNGVVQLGRSLQENDHILDSLRVRLLLFTIGGVLAAAVLGWLLATRLVAPITRLRRSAETIARTGNLDGEIPSGGTGEVGSLTTSFATMVGALAESRQRQQQLVADASHELRTPLTSLQTNAELLDRVDRLTDAQRHQVSEGIRYEVRELTDLVSELVDLARDPDTDAEPVGTVALSETTLAVVEAARRRTDRLITTAVAGESTVTGRSKALTRAISNLVDNAIKHGDGEIDVSIRDRTVEVRDHGRGIPESDLQHVFDRFYRADVARTEPGSGLGLSIVAQVVERHGGSVFARNHPDGGAVVGFTLPDTKAQPRSTS